MCDVERLLTTYITQSDTVDREYSSLYTFNCTEAAVRRPTHHPIWLPIALLCFPSNISPPLVLSAYFSPWLPQLDPSTGSYIPALHPVDWAVARNSLYNIIIDCFEISQISLCLLCHLSWICPANMIGELSAWVLWGGWSSWLRTPTPNLED